MLIDMLSRTAENLYWISRYMERAETMARLLDVGYRMSLFPNPKGTIMNGIQFYLLQVLRKVIFQNIMKSIKTMLRIICFLSRKIHPQFTAVYRKQETMLYWLEQLLPQRRGLP